MTGLAQRSGWGRWHDLVYRTLARFQNWQLPQPLPIRLRSNRVYVLPTPFGLFFGSFTLVMIFAGLNYNNNMALMMAFLVAGMALLVPLYTVRNLIDLEIIQITAQPVFAGQDVVFSVSVLNEHSQPRRVVWVDNRHGIDVADIPASGRANLSLRQPTTRRGWWPMQRTRIFTRYPAGIFQAWSWLEPDVRYLAYPQPEDNAPPLPQGGFRGSGRPERSGDEEWSGLREYQPGDPSRWIAWKAVARTDDMVTKTFAQHESQRVELDYASLVELDLEARLSRLTRWVLVANDRKLAYTLHLPGRSIGPDHGDAHAHECLRALAEFG